MARSEQPAPPVARRPPRLWWAATAIGLEALAMLGFGIWLLVENQVAEASNEDVAAGSGVYFVVLGLLALVIAWFLWRESSWAFGATLFVQILAIPIAFTMAIGGFWLGAVVLLAVVALGLAGLFSAPTRAAFGR